MKKIALALFAACTVAAASAQKSKPMYIYSDDALLDVVYTGDVEDITYLCDGEDNSVVTTQRIRTAQGFYDLPIYLINRVSFTDPDAISFKHYGDLNLLTSKAFLELVYDYKNNPDQLKFIGNLPAVILYWQKGSADCDKMKVSLKQLAKDYAGKVDFYMIDREEETEVSEFMKVTETPSVFFYYKEGQPVVTKGLIETDSIKDIIDKTFFAPIPVPEDFAKPGKKAPIVAVEFTGQRCRYCPGMSRGLHDMEKRYGESKFIITAMHNLERFSILPESLVSLYNEESSLYGKSIDVPDGLPHVYYNSLGTKIDDLPVDDQFKQPDLLECTGTVSLNADKKYVINVKTRLRSDRQDFIKDKKIDILFWSIENNVIAFQDDNGRQDYNYVHDDLFRGSINGTWGEPYNIGTEYNGTFAVPAPVSVAENTEVVVFFLNHDTLEILDAGKFKLTTPEE